MAQNSLDRLQGLLCQLFQFEVAEDLDFGMYRIMNYKRAEVEHFINEGLPAIVEDALSSGAATRQADLARDLEEKAEQVRQTLGPDAVSPDGELDPQWSSTKIGEDYLKLQSRAQGAADQEALKAAVFNHLYTFFSRYYEGGDFLSRKRYSKRQKYAIPYNGEEVYLHWANADQYYIKTGEQFTDYRYKAPNGVIVQFRLVAANVEQNNIKGEDRYFIPRTEDAGYDRETSLLTIPFEHRPLTRNEESAHGAKKNERQERIIEDAADRLLENFKNKPEALAALEREKPQNSKDEPVSYLEHHLRRYVRGNTSDFFIHKDLKGFLDGELDFYLKNEVLDIDDLDRWGEEGAEGWFEVMRAMKRIGREIIAFLAQIEDFQKKLFEKKKFVTGAEYCLTLDNVPEELYPEILENDEQFREWEQLFSVSEIPASLENGGGNQRSVEWLQSNPYLVLDTRFFDQGFKDRLLASVEDLDERTDGLLIRSENFQALNLMQERYREQVKCVYIDPPFNTGNDEFIYKDSYQHSSWLSMVKDRVLLARRLMHPEGLFISHIDEHEFTELQKLLLSWFRENQNLGPIVWDKRNPKGDATRISAQHEYLCVATRDYEALKASGGIHRKKENAEAILGVADRLIDQAGGVNEEVRDKFKKWLEKQPFAGGERAYNQIDDRGEVFQSVSMAWPNKQKAPDEYFEPLIHPVTGKPCPVPERGWRNPPETMLRLMEEDLILFGLDETTQPRRKYLLKDNMTENVPSLLYYGGSDDNLFSNLQLSFPNPKPIRIAELLVFMGVSDGSGVALDFFAGSGTTGHAVINLNREDGGGRKYVLVEMGEYFDTVLKPRIQKVIYSKDWKDGKPTSRDTGVSHIFKYLTLEQYEDTLNNISFTHEEEGTKALELYGDDYLLRYMLDFETRGSETLLNVEKMSAPFSYKLTLHDVEETLERPVDLPETFAYLLGMRVRSRKAHHDGERRYLVYRGSMPEAGEVVVIWRNTEGWGTDELEGDREFVEQEGLTEDADEVFVNGDSFIPEAQPLEPVFKQRMLAEPVNG